PARADGRQHRLRLRRQRRRRGALAPAQRRPDARRRPARRHVGRPLRRAPAAAHRLRRRGRELLLVRAVPRRSMAAVRRQRVPRARTGTVSLVDGEPRGALGAAGPDRDRDGDQHDRALDWRSSRRAARGGHPHRLDDHSGLSGRGRLLDGLRGQRRRGARRMARGGGRSPPGARRAPRGGRVMTAPGRKKVLVAGASGLIGHAAVNEFARRGDWDVVGVSRRTPGDVDGATLLSVDLMDPGACRRVFGAMSDVTHLVYAALYEQPGRLLEGWLEREQMERNDAMLRNLFEPLAAAAANLEHISVLQGLKAYGTHAGFLPPPIPAVERSPRVEHENFYWLQEDYLRGKQATERFSLTIWRPHIVFGADVGNNMNPMAALGAYAVLLREEGRPLDFPWGEPTVFQAVDVELFARALVWAATSSASHNETFNFANGDVFTIREVWPAVADAMGMEVGEDR